MLVCSNKPELAFPDFAEKKGASCYFMMRSKRTQLDWCQWFSLFGGTVLLCIFVFIAWIMLVFVSYCFAKTSESHGIFWHVSIVFGPRFVLYACAFSCVLTSSLWYDTSGLSCSSLHVSLYHCIGLLVISYRFSLLAFWNLVCLYHWYFVDEISIFG